MLRTNEQFTLAAEIGLKEQRPEDTIVHALVDFDDIDYFTQADLLYDLAGQMVTHLRSYLSEAEALNVLDRDRRLIAREIHAQMLAHFFEEATGYEVQVSRGFTELKPCNYTATAGQAPRHFRATVEDVGAIRQMLFGGFTKCLYPLVKFDSDTRRQQVVQTREGAVPDLLQARHRAAGVRAGLRGGNGRDNHHGRDQEAGRSDHRRCKGQGRCGGTLVQIRFRARQEHRWKAVAIRSCAA